jgi:ATP-dependent RNA helicase RhlE
VKSADPNQLMLFMTFKQFKLDDPILRALSEKGYTVPTSIQLEAIPHILSGRDVLASAQTGTGKTAAFCLPILQNLSVKSNNAIKALILVPTRELAIQVADNLKYYSKYLSVTNTVIFGGVSQVPQVKSLQKGVDILVATPGRLLDLMQQRLVDLSSLQMLVLDEADRMLDMGFINDIERILKKIPAVRQNIFFSATMPAGIHNLIGIMMNNPVKIAVAKKVEDTKIKQSVYYVSKDKKRALLKHIIVERKIENAIVFARTKYGADKLARDLSNSGITAEAFHGDKSQQSRVRSLSNFKKNLIRVLVATDIAARGIDIADLPFVINYELPDSAETYTHRIGRTGRAGASGHALSLCDHEEKGQLKNINRVLSNNLQVITHPFV